MKDSRTISMPLEQYYEDRMKETAEGKRLGFIYAYEYLAGNSTYTDHEETREWYRLKKLIDEKLKAVAAQ